MSNDCVLKNFKKNKMKKSVRNANIILSILTLCYFFAGCKKTDEDSLKFPKIVASFTNTFDASTGTAVFTSTSKFGNNYFWDFGDGITSTQENPMHTYTKSGDFPVILKVTNSAGAVATITQTVNVTIIIPPTLLPVSIPISFDAVTVDYTTITGFGTQFSLVTNPFLSGTNSGASKVGKIEAGGASNFQGITIPFGTAVDFSINKKSITLQVYSTIVTDILVKLASGVNSARENEVLVQHKGTGWETLEFNFATSAVKSYIAGDAANGQAFVPTGSYKEIDLFVGFNLPGITSTFYIDDMMQVESTVVTPTCTADAVQSLMAANFNFTFSSDPGTVAAPSSVSGKIISDNTIYTFADNPKTTSTLNPSCKVGKITRTAGNLYGNSQIVLDAKIDFSANAGFKMKVYSPKAGTIVDVKLEDKAAGGTNKEVQITTTKANEWEELTFDFAAAETNKYDRLVIFFDLGGDNADVYYFDDLKLYARTVTPPPPFNGGLIVNGDFQAATSAPWIKGVSDNDPAPTVTMGTNTYYSVNVTTAGNSYDVNLSQKLNITQGKTYTLTFDAWSDVSRSIIAGIGLSGGSFANDAKTQDITTTRTTYTLTLSSAAFGAADARVLFDLGAAVGLVNIDNVSLVEGTGGGGTGGGCTGTLVAATAFPVDFESCQTFLPSNNFGAGLTSSIVVNPDKSGINTSAFVLQVDKPTGSDFYAGIQNPFPADLDLTKPFTMKIYSKKAGVVFNIGVNNSPDKPGVGLPGPQFATVAAANTWTLVTVTFTGLPPGSTANQLYIKPDNPMGDPAITAGSTYYIDDITQ